MILRTKFYKKNYLKYISHLDMMRLFHRNFNKAGIPIYYSEGFNPHPKFSIANPLTLGLESEDEYMDIEMDFMEINDFINKMNDSLPKDIQITKAVYLDKPDSVAGLIEYAEYDFTFELDKSLEDIQADLDQFLDNDEIIIKRLGKKKGKRVEKEENIRPFIRKVSLRQDGRDFVLNALVKSGSNGNLKPSDFINAFIDNRDLNMEKDSISIIRRGQYGLNDQGLYKPL